MLGYAKALTQPTSEMEIGMLGKSTALVLVVIATLAVPPAHAQNAFPSKPIRMMVPFPPGGFVDILTRLMTPRMAEGLGQPVLIDNRPGANGNIAIDTVAKAAPDGYTLVLAQVSNLAINPSIYKDLPFDPIKDLVSIGFVATASQVMVVSAASDLKSVADVMAAAKAKPGEIMFASSGNGSLGHLGSELMQQQAGIKFLHIPYKGAAPAVIDVLGGRAHLFVAALPSVIGQIRAGKLRALAVTSTTRLAELPDVPPLAEAGFPGFEATNWLAVMGRAGTPPAIVDRLNAELNKALQSDEIKQRYASEGAAVFTGPPKQLADALAADLAKWAQVIKQAGIKME
jgi:tripartite-type tricarboxylate transporter receptor subunit TctC